jgi:lysophospholipase L1-like esterase
LTRTGDGGQNDGAVLVKKEIPVSRFFKAPALSKDLNKVISTKWPEMTGRDRDGLVPFEQKELLDTRQRNNTFRSQPAVRRQTMRHRRFLRISGIAEGFCFSTNLSEFKLGLTRISVAATCVVVVLAAVAATPAALAHRIDHDPDGHWVSAWQGSPMPGGTFFSPGCPSDVGLTDQTVRNIVYLSAGGSRVRVRISNAYGSEPLNVGAATVAISAGGAATVPGTTHTLRFSGKSSIIVAADSEALSDPVNLRIPALSTLAVSVFLPDSTGLATQHFLAVQNNYIASGDMSGVSDGDGSGFTQKISCWMFVSGVDVKGSPRDKGALVTLGDSITDGYLSTTNANRRFPDVIARRLAARNGETLSVSNAAITGNELLTNRPQFPQFGYAIPSRLARDVLNQTDAKAVILLAGINDIGDRSTKAEELIAADQQIILACHEAGLKIYGATLTPFGGSNAIYGGDYGTPAGEQERQKLNQWIRTSNAFDGVIDFDKALRDPADPTKLLAAYAGDALHPNDAGYQVMGDTVDLDAIIEDIDHDEW